jgi:hypothetical protein
MARQQAWVGTLIRKAMGAVDKQCQRKVFKEDVNTFMKHGRALLDALDRLEGCPENEIPQHAQIVIRAAHRFHGTGLIDAILSKLSTSAGELDPNSINAIIMRVERLARYKNCSAYLARLAKKLGIFRHAEVVSVSLDPQLFVRDTEVPPDSLQQCIGRCKNNTRALLPSLKIIEQKVVTNSTFMSFVKNRLRESKVHAEVQIVCHYELHPATIRPRVIRSSKDACYLCNLLIQIHGKYYIPRTHGILYPGWRLLPVPGLNSVHRQLNRTLEARIRDALLKFFSSGGSPVMQNRNESAVFPPLPLFSRPASTVVAEGSGGHDAWADRTGPTTQERFGEETASSAALPCSEERCEKHTDHSLAKEANRIPSAPSPSPESPQPPPPPPPPPPQGRS